jgi:hypothetical protein
VSHKQGLRYELAPDAGQAVLMGRHCGLSRVVENFCLETVRKKWAQRKAEETYGITGDDLTEVPWSAPALEREWRARRRELFPWFGEGKLSSRIPKEACRVRAAGFCNYLKSRQGRRKGPRMGFPELGCGRGGRQGEGGADRAADQDGLGQVQNVDQAEQVGDVGGQGVAVLGTTGATAAPAVERDHPVVGGEVGELGLLDPAAGGPPVDEHQRAAGAVVAVEESGALDGGVRHVGSPRIVVAGPAGGRSF